MNLEENLSTSSRRDAINMAIEIIEIELYAQFLVLGISPESFPKDNNVTLEDVVAPPVNCSESEWLAYNSIPRLINKRATLLLKLEEINNA